MTWPTARRNSRLRPGLKPQGLFLGFKVWGLGVSGLGFRVTLGFKVWGLGFGV